MPDQQIAVEQTALTVTITVGIMEKVPVKEPYSSYEHSVFVKEEFSKDNFDFDLASDQVSMKAVNCLETAKQKHKQKIKDNLKSS